MVFIVYGKFDHIQKIKHIRFQRCLPQITWEKFRFKSFNNLEAKPLSLDKIVMKQIFKLVELTVRFVQKKKYLK